MQETIAKDHDFVCQPVNRWPDELRPRERLIAHGPNVLSDAELLAILLRTGTRKHNVMDVARGVLARHGGLSQLSHLLIHEWLETPGIGTQKAATVLAALELGRRTWSQTGPDAKLLCADDVYRYMQPRFLGESRESMWILGLDAKSVVTIDALVSAGTANFTSVHAREVFRPLIRASAIKGILCHNHPSGNPEPSRKDIDITHRLTEAGQLIGIPLVDHVVVGSSGYTSLREQGIFD